MQAFETRNEIKARIMREAAREWGFKGTNDIDLNTFDPVVDLMIGACSFELEKLSHELANSRTRIFERMLEVLTPEILSSAQPAYGIIHANPIEAKHIARKDEQYYCKSAEHKKDFFFAPLDEFKLFDAKIKHVAFDDKIYSVNERLEKDISSNTHYGQNLPGSTYYIGLEVNPHIRSIDDLTFYFDWNNQVNKNELLQYLTTSTWSIGGYELAKVSGHNNVEDHEETDTILSALGFSNFITKKVHAICKPHFVTIKEHQLQMSDIKSKYPSIFATCFDESFISSLQDELIWIEIHVPPILNEYLNNLQVLINCFPVINRRLVEKQDKLEGDIHILPLELLGEYFVGIESVHNSSQIPYSEIAIKDTEKIDFGMYALRTNGVKRFDNREAKDMMEYIMDLITSETSAFKGIAYSALSSDFQELDQVFTRIKKNVTLTSREIQDSCYLFAKPFLNDNMIYLKYWTSDGERANRVPRNTILKQHNSANYHSNSCVIVSATTGGKAPKNNEESVHQFKETVLSRNRVVTKEDIKKMCINQMGKQNIKSINVENGVLYGKTNQEGLRACIFVYIEKNLASSINQEEYQQLCLEVETKLNDSSMGVYPIRIRNRSKVS